MKCMERNKVDFWYALYEGKEPVENDQGHKTGEYKVIHSKPEKGRANISPAKGETDTMQFGESLLYDKVVVMDNPPIDELSVLWVDTLPELDENGEPAIDNSGNVITPYDYTVEGIANSLNNTLFAISKVKVRGVKLNGD